MTDINVETDNVARAGPVSVESIEEPEGIANHTLESNIRLDRARNFRDAMGDDAMSAIKIPMSAEEAVAVRQLKDVCHSTLSTVIRNCIATGACFMRYTGILNRFEGSQIALRQLGHVNYPAVKKLVNSMKPLPNLREDSAMSVRIPGELVNYIETFIASKFYCDAKTKIYRYCLNVGLSRSFRTIGTNEKTVFETYILTVHDDLEQYERISHVLCNAYEFEISLYMDEAGADGNDYTS